ncbi:hypothetical protein F7734_27105 [Scytonema sp. UIC 10036]|nr:hypothetical protein [Scytonema sp. UIC 10036]
MANCLKVVAPHLHSDLVSPEALSQLQALAQILPPLSMTAGFECRLGCERSQVDFCVKLPCLPANLPDKFLQHPVWQAIQAFCQEWIEPTSFLHQQVNNIWLEFDVVGQIPEVPIPSIFLALNEENNSDIPRLIETVLKIFNLPSFNAQLNSNLQLCIDSLPTGASIRQLGFMLSRSVDGMRVVVGGLSPQHFSDYLEKIGWSAQSEQRNIFQSLVSTVSEFVDSIRILNLDVGEIIYPKVGWECYLEKQPQQEPRWQLFLNHLVDMGLCTPEKKNALLIWPGWSQKASQPELWPQNLSWSDIFLSSRATSIFGRVVNHIKIVYQPGYPLEAKAYLGFVHSWVNADTYINSQV